MKGTGIVKMVNNEQHVNLTEADLSIFRTRVCEQHRGGNCFNSDRCPHSHCQTWQRRNPDEFTYSSKLCPEIEFVKKGAKMSLVRRCSRGRGCMFAHSKEEELYHPTMYKTKMCKSYPQCMRYFCPFAHSWEEIRKPATPNSNPLSMSLTKDSLSELNVNSSNHHGWNTHRTKKLVHTLRHDNNIQSQKQQHHHHQSTCPNSPMSSSTTASSIPSPVLTALSPSSKNGFSTVESKIAPVIMTNNLSEECLAVLQHIIDFGNRCCPTITENQMQHTHDPLSEFNQTLYNLCDPTVSEIKTKKTQLTTVTDDSHTTLTDNMSCSEEQDIYHVSQQHSMKQFNYPSSNAFQLNSPLSTKQESVNNTSNLLEHLCTRHHPDKDSPFMKEELFFSYNKEQETHHRLCNKNSTFLNDYGSIQQFTEKSINSILIDDHPHNPEKINSCLKHLDTIPFEKLSETMYDQLSQQEIVEDQLTYNNKPKTQSIVGNEFMSMNSSFNLPYSYSKEIPSQQSLHYHSIESPIGESLLFECSYPESPPVTQSLTLMNETIYNSLSSIGLDCPIVYDNEKLLTIYLDNSADAMKSEINHTPHISSNDMSLFTIPCDLSHKINVKPIDKVECINDTTQLSTARQYHHMTDNTNDAYTILKWFDSRIVSTTDSLFENTLQQQISTNPSQHDMIMSHTMLSLPSETHEALLTDQMKDSLTTDLMSSISTLSSTLLNQYASQDANTQLNSYDFNQLNDVLQTSSYHDIFDMYPLYKLMEDQASSVQHHDSESCILSQMKISADHVCKYHPICEETQDILHQQIDEDTHHELYHSLKTPSNTDSSFVEQVLQSTEDHYITDQINTVLSSIRTEEQDTHRVYPLNITSSHHPTPIIPEIVDLISPLFYKEDTQGTHSFMMRNSQSVYDAIIQQLSCDHLIPMTKKNQSVHIQRYPHLLYQDIYKLSHPLCKDQLVDQSTFNHKESHAPPIHCSHHTSSVVVDNDHSVTLLNTRISPPPRINSNLIKEDYRIYTVNEEHPLNQTTLPLLHLVDTQCHLSH